MKRISYGATFRLQHDATYEQRYQKLLEAFGLIGTGYKFWFESTSYVAFASDLSIDQIETVIGRAINLRTDVVLIEAHEYKIARAVGQVKDDSIFALIPYLPRSSSPPADILGM